MSTNTINVVEGIIEAMDQSAPPQSSQPSRCYSPAPGNSHLLAASSVSGSSVGDDDQSGQVMGNEGPTASGSGLLAIHHPSAIAPKTDTTNLPPYASDKVRVP